MSSEIKAGDMVKLAWAETIGNTFVVLVPDVHLQLSKYQPGPRHRVLSHLTGRIIDMLSSGLEKIET